MKRLVARKLSYRVVALLCFAMGAGWHFWITREKPIESQIMVQPVPTLQTLLEVRQIYSGYEHVGHFLGCAAYVADLENPRLSLANRYREKACLLESEEARKLMERNWGDKKKTYIEIQIPCLDCLAVTDVLIEQNKDGEWQMTIRGEPDRWNTGPQMESAAVYLRRRAATESDSEVHVIGESLLVFEDAKGHEILTL